MDPATRQRAGRLQSRIDDALREPIEEASASSYSEYLPGGSTELQDALIRAAGPGGLDALERIFDAFDRLRPSADAGRLRHALAVVLSHHPAVAEFGLRLPSLQERSRWKTWPSTRE
jgi:hypothetical protein